MGVTDNYHAVKIGASLVLVEGGTEVVLEVSEFILGKTGPRTFTVARIPEFR